MSPFDAAGLRGALERVTLGPEINEEDGSTEFLVELAGDAPSVVYHYASVDALHSIVTRRQLWASHTSFLNDTTEIAHGLNLCRDRLHARANHRHSHFTSTTLDVLDSSIGQTEDRGFDAYVVCFSDSDDLVAQWKGYATGGAGYAIGFDLGKTAVATDTAPFRVIYSQIEQDLILDAAIDGYLGVLDRSLKAHQKDQEKTARSVGLALVSLLARLLVGFKSELFSHEREWRLVEFIPRADTNRQARVQFRPARGAIVPYIALALGEQSSTLPIKHVQCGPTGASGIDVDGAERFLRAAGLSCRVTKSRAPVRF